MTQAPVADALIAAFPEVSCGVTPFGSRVIVQFRTPRKKSSGGIYLTDDTRESEKWNTQIAKVIAVGPVAFKNRTTLKEWPEKAWVTAGMFVRVNKFGGDKWEVTVDGSGSEDKAVFAVFNDLDLIGLVEGDPLTIKAYI